MLFNPVNTEFMKDKYLLHAGQAVKKPPDNYSGGFNGSDITNLVIRSVKVPLFLFF